MKINTSQLSKLIADRKFDYVSPVIEKAEWNTKEIGSDYKLFHFDRHISSEDAIKEMEKEGYRAANIHELLLWGDWNDSDLVIALGSVTEVRGGRYVPGLGRGGSERRLHLYWLEVGWSAYCRFLGVKTGSKIEKVLECTHEITYCPDCGKKIR